MYMVEWKKIGEVTQIIRGNRVTKSDLKDDGMYPVISGGFSPLGYINRYNRDENTITIAQYGSAGYVDWQKEKFWANDVCYSVYPLEVLNNRFLYYSLINKQYDIYSLRTNAVPAHLPLKTLQNVDIQVPSLSEQQRIVDILDTFTSSIDNLKQQIAQRRKQYEYYRDQLLDLEGKEGVEMKYLLDVLAQPVTDGPHETPSFYEDGIPFISADAIVDNKINFSRKRGYISEEYDRLCQKKYKPQLNDIYLVKSGSTTGKVAIVRTDERFNIWSPLAAIRVNQRNHPYFVYYMLQTKKVQDQVKLKSSQGSQPNLSMRVLEKFIIPVPPLSEQQRIVSILDTFEASIQNLEAQLSQREKQYEYYRNKLLTFE